MEPAGRLRSNIWDGEWTREGPRSHISGGAGSRRPPVTCKGGGAGIAFPGRAMAGRPWGAPGGTLKGNSSALLNASQQAPGGGGGDARPRPSWLASTLAFILIFTIVVDVVGNLLVILSVYRNKKLRNAGRGSRGRAGWTGSPQLSPDGSFSPFWPPFQNAALPSCQLAFLKKSSILFLKTEDLE